MNKTLALIITATVLLMASLVVITLTSSSVGDFGENAQSTKRVQQCNYQYENAEKPSEISQRCWDRATNNGNAEQVIYTNVCQDITRGRCSEIEP